MGEEYYRRPDIAKVIFGVNILELKHNLEGIVIVKCS